MLGRVPLCLWPYLVRPASKYITSYPQQSTRQPPSGCSWGFKGFSVRGLGTDLQVSKSGSCSTEERAFSGRTTITGQWA